MKSASLKSLLILLVIACLAIGCKSSALNDAGQAEKQKEQTQVDSRANAIDKMNDQAASK